MAHIRELTREAQESPKGRAKRWIKSHWLTVVFLGGVTVGCAWQNYVLNRQLALKDAALHQVLRDSTAKGCPAWDTPSTILITADSPKAARRLLDKAVFDIENFQVALGKIPE